VWRIRVGDSRIIYEIIADELTATIVRAGHRSDMYNR
jgi:mRNA interferase RelE/StbE